MENRIEARPCVEQCITHSSDPHVLTNINVFSKDSQWLIYDIRSNNGDTFDGQRIECVHIETGEVRVVHRAIESANVGVATFDPSRNRVVFIEGPRNPTPDFPYGFPRRHGRIVDLDTNESFILDARDLVSPFTPGALRGGTHVHVFSPDGAMVSSTYEDHLLDRLGTSGNHDRNQRTIAVSQLDHPTAVPRTHPFNHDGVSHTIVVTATTNHPQPGSDEINRAVEDAWIGDAGYTKPDGTRQRRALAFQGFVVLEDGRTIREVFVVDLPDDLSAELSRDLPGTTTTRPIPPRSCRQRRITFSGGREFPGIDGPRHWLRSSPDGSQIAFLARDDQTGIAQIWTVSPNGGALRRVTDNPVSIESAFTWSPDGRFIAHLIDGSVAVTRLADGRTFRLTEKRALPEEAPKTHGAIFSPDGQKIAFVRPVRAGNRWVDQVCVVRFEGAAGM